MQGKYNPIIGKTATRWMIQKRDFLFSKERPFKTVIIPAVRRNNNGTTARYDPVGIRKWIKNSRIMLKISIPEKSSINLKHFCKSPYTSYKTASDNAEKAKKYYLTL